MGPAGPIWIGTIIFVILTIPFALFPGKLLPGNDASLNRLLAITTGVCLWLLWLSTYMAQMYPIPGVVPEKKG